MPLRTPEIMGILLELDCCGRCGGGDFCGRCGGGGGGSLKKDFKSY
jgi:hypothetical protein